jgi:hypothetical protein
MRCGCNAAVEVATAVIAYGLRVWPMRHTRMARHHRRLIEARAHRLLVWLALVAWSVRYLSYLGLWEPTVTVAGELLTTRIQVGSFGTSAADVLAFVLTLWLAYLLSALVRFVLEEEVYPRTGIATPRVRRGSAPMPARGPNDPVPDSTGSPR